MHYMELACLVRIKCWVVHETDKNEKIIQNNQEVFETLFNMMEKMTERIVQMETVI